jgi:hypothetical protein
MDKVQKFISENQHQFGYIMQEASRQWIAKDPIGALTVGQCAGTIKNNGAYIQLLDKVERYERALKTIASESHDILAKGVCTRTLENSQTEK